MREKRRRDHRDDGGRTHSSWKTEGPEPWEGWVWKCFLVPSIRLALPPSPKSRLLLVLRTDAHGRGTQNRHTQARQLECEANI